MRKREEMPVEMTWDMSAILPSDAAWEELYKKTEESLPDYEQYKDRVAESAVILFECLKFNEELSLQVEKLYVYGKQKSDEDTGNQKYQDYAERARALSYRADRLSSYIVPEILAMNESVLDCYRREHEGLSHYNRALDLILKKKDHTLSVEMEELLARSYEATQGASQIFNMFNNADVKFPAIKGANGETVVITHGNFIELMESSNRKVRESAFHALYGVYRQFANTLASTFSANVKQSLFYATARHYRTSRAYYLFENEIPLEVYDNLLAAVHEDISCLHRYVKLRKAALGLDEIHMYDLYVPIVSGVTKKIPFETARKMVIEGLAPLGKEYGSVLEEGFNNRWIDVYENEGKRSGAYSWGAYGSHPYVLLNYNDTLDQVFTLAHEMGHSLHSYYSDRNQSYTYAGYKIFVAEVASTCNEALLIRHLLSRTKDRNERGYLINHFLESFRTTLYRQAMFAEFELQVHEKVQNSEPLTADLLCGMYHRLNEAYFGPEMIVDSDIDYEWARIPHFYTPFYVYQYATGFSAAMAISSKILSGDKDALSGYFKFLSGGCSMPPIELLKLCGVDMSTSEPVKEALKVFKDLLDEFEELIKEKGAGQ